MSRAKGFDISYWQADKIDFPAAKADGYDFVVCRASHGTRKDATFLPNIKKAKAAGFVVGAYHYIYVVNKLQMQPLIDQVYAAGGVDFPVFLDVERYSNAGATVAQWRSVINSNTKALEDAGFEVGFYTSYWMWKSLTNNMKTINGKPAEDYTMWTAHWSTVAEPAMPVPWKEWELWQQGSSLTPPWNKAGRTDFGVYNGTTDELRKKYLDEPLPTHDHAKEIAMIDDIMGRLNAVKEAL